MDPSLLEKAAEVVRKGGVVALPTETVYGLVCDPFNPTAVARIYEIKGRPEKKPLVLFVRTAEEAQRYAADLSSEARLLMEAFWPGPLTLVVRASEKAPHPLVVKDQTLGMRCPDHEAPQRLMEALDLPLASTSANRSGKPPLLTGEAVERELPEVDVVIPGTAPGGTPSTVVDATRTPPVVLRKGALSLAKLEEVIGGPVRLAPNLPYHVLLVCTGNTCRSPMAEMLLKALLPPKVRERVIIDSAGTAAYEGGPVAPETIRVLEEIDIPTDRGKRSKRLTQELVEWADLILVMERAHLLAVSEMGGGAKAHLLGGEEGEIPDPIGKGPYFYRMVRDGLKQLLETRWIPYIQERVGDDA